MLFQTTMLKKTIRALRVCFLLVCAPSFAQELLLSEIIESDGITTEQVQSAISVVESRQGLDAETRGKVVEYLRETQAQIQNKLNAEAAAGKYASTLDTAPAQTDALRATLDEPSAGSPTAASFGIDERTTLADLQQMLAKETADLTAVESRFAELKAQVDAELVRPAAARDRINQLRKSREDLARIANIQEIPSEPQILTNARKLSAQQTRAAQGAEISKLEQELLSNAVRTALLQTQRDVAARTLSELTQRATFLRGMVDERLQDAAVQAQQAAAAAERAMAGKHPVLRRLAEGNAALTRKLPELSTATAELNNKLEQMTNEAADIEQRLAQSRRRLEIGGLNRVLGSLLIAEHRSLPQLSQYTADIRARNRDAAEVGLERVHAQEQRRELASLDQAVQDLMTEVVADSPGEEALAVTENEIRQLLRVRRNLLLQVESSYGSYLQALGNLDSEQHQLLDSTDRYQQFLARNLLWIPSAPIIFKGIFGDGWSAYPQSMSPEAWVGVAAQLAEAIGTHIGAGIFCLALLMFLLLIDRPLKRQYESMSNKIGRLATDRIVYTIASLGIVAIRVLPIPFLALSTAWFLDNAPHPTAFSGAVARSLDITTPFIYNVLLFRAFSAPGGIFSLHFGWQQKNVDVIRRQLHRLATFGSALIFVTVLLFLSEVDSDRATFGRLIFITLMVFIAGTIRPILRPDSGVFASHYQRYPETWETKLRWIWFGLGVGVPLLLAVVSGLGYLYTSTVLAGMLVDTFWRVLTLLVLYLVVLRWLALARRKLAVHLALKDRESRLSDGRSDQPPDTGVEVASSGEVPLNIDQVDQQSRKLLQSAMIVLAIFVCWNIWADVLPAFSFLNEVGLWTQTVMRDGVEIILPVTLADLLLAILIVVVFVIASRNLPGLMEVVILQRLSLEPGSRYAINTLVRYVVVTVGTFSVLNVIGWNWSQIQWLVAALSVGLGFGLQEIVANFVSGLIILFERPVRVGDTVTVGQLTGTVSRIRIRATTITDWDRKEILVPNKSFITEQVINWTLSDPITRVVIPVGISYGSDVDAATKVMSDTLASLSLVLDEPAPKVYFTGFGDSSLNFTLHAYLRQLSDRMPLVHEVHEAILRALRANGIEIPFPQHDIHIRSAIEGKSDKQ